jgi:CheY-like chemotaxis protein
MIEKKTRQPCPNCKNWGYMVYLLDINMPVMDGLDTVKELKRRMNDKLIPKGLCIANTGYSDLETKQKAM